MGSGHICLILDSIPGQFLFVENTPVNTIGRQMGEEAALVEMRMNGVFGWSRNVGPGIVPARPSPSPPRGSLGDLLGGKHSGSTMVGDEIL